jgi:hypothetical protein
LWAPVSGDETDLKQFIAMLESHGYGEDHPIYLNEGAYFYPLRVPAWMGIAPWASTSVKDRYTNMLTPSYDIGWGERVSAAMLLRYWLVCYKYMDRIQCATPWVPLLIDNDTPYAWVAMSNALANVLGDSTYRADVRFAPDSRAYVFEQPDGSPVAATWHFSENMDRGKEVAQMIYLDAGGLSLEVIDMMGNVHAPVRKEGRYVIPLSGFPVYLRAEPGQEETLIEALESCQFESADMLPVAVSGSLIDRSTVAVQITNPLTRPFHGQVEIDGGGLSRVSIEPQGEYIEQVWLDKDVPFNRVEHVDIPVSVHDDATDMAVTASLSFDAFAIREVREGDITLDGDLSDWADLDAIAFENLVRETGAGRDAASGTPADDFSATYKMAWSDEALYLLIDVKDDTFVVQHDGKDPKGWYDNDAVQLFVDPMGDGIRNAQAGIYGYNMDDFSYELLPTGPDSAIVYRRLAPDQQLTGGMAGLQSGVIEPGVECRFQRYEGGYRYEVKFPARYVAPLRLTGGSVCGFAIKVYDRDSEVESADKTLRNSPGETDYFKRPDVFPQMLMVGRNVND